jgi:hypothetical protein
MTYLAQVVPTGIAAQRASYRLFPVLSLPNPATSSVTARSARAQNVSAL